MDDAVRRIADALWPTGSSTTGPSRTDCAGGGTRPDTAAVLGVVLRPEYPGWWPHPVRVLRPGGLLVVDNVLSHPDEVAPFLALRDADPAVVRATVPSGKGQVFAVRGPSGGG